MNKFNQILNINKLDLIRINKIELNKKNLIFSKDNLFKLYLDYRKLKRDAFKKDPKPIQRLIREGKNTDIYIDQKNKKKLKKSLIRKNRKKLKRKRIFKLLYGLFFFNRKLLKLFVFIY